MAIEHEYKFILTDNHPELIQTLKDSVPEQFIHQIYLNKSIRFRKIVKISKKKTSTKFYHTFKKRIDDDVLEIESEITPEDFMMVQKADCICSLHKYRYTIKQIHGQWDIDFLVKHETSNEVYIAMAECEQPKGFEVVVPEVLKPYIRFEVPYEHSTYFSNFKMCDQEYAKQALIINRLMLKEFQ